MSQKSVHVIIEGRVQGVWYRGWTVEQAQELGLTGWVRNLKNGNVEAVFYGDPQKVDEILERCWQGPPLARVDGVVQTPASTPENNTFEQRPTG